MASVETANEIGALREKFTGELVVPTDPDYASARLVWNGMIDRRPALVARPRGAADVAALIEFARERSLEIAVRGGGHNVAGFGTCDGGVVIDLSRMTSVLVDVGGRVARAGGGLTWGALDAATQQHALATTGGLVSTTGIGGFTLGGGIGWLMRSRGLACDNLVGATVVTAEGTIETATERENADLLWALRGGGGNFGVVTELALRLHPLGPMVQGGVAMYPADRAGAILRFFRELADGASHELTLLFAAITAPPAPFVPQHLQGKPVVAIAACWSGTEEEGVKALRPLKSFGPPAIDLIGPIPYLELQKMFDAGAPAGLRNYWKSTDLGELGDPAIEALVDHSSRMASPFSAIHVHQMGGAVSRIPADATAYRHRDAKFVVNLIATWADPSEDPRHTAWARDAFAALSPHASGVYVNFLGAEGAERVRSAYGASYARLLKTKRRYDPKNLFRLNQNIAP